MRLSWGAVRRMLFGDHRDPERVLAEAGFHDLHEAVRWVHALPVRTGISDPTLARMDAIRRERPDLSVGAMRWLAEAQPLS